MPQVLTTRHLGRRVLTPTRGTLHRLYRQHHTRWAEVLPDNGPPLTVPAEQVRLAHPEPYTRCRWCGDWSLPTGCTTCAPRSQHRGDAPR